ncbi:MAG: SDR family oxidoreductase [Candidatus Tectomicrobia bacterium]|nr:SDR family oxidoreductase [Candidatus Tectomicrobia bacterium]
MEGYTLEGKIALVTGVEHPVAQAAATTLAEAGASVAVLAGQAGSAHQAEAEQVAEAVRQQQRDARAYAIDVTQVEAIQSVIDDLVQHWGRLDILVNGLDKPFAAPFLDITEAQEAHILAHTLGGTLHVIRAAARHMVTQQHGRIITYLSVLAERGVANCSLYSMTQTALLQLTRSLAIEWGTHGVTVNAIGSGWMENSPLLPSDDTELQRLQRFIPNHRLGQPDDLAALTVYLASDMGGNITGQTMYIEGGLLSHP